MADYKKPLPDLDDPNTQPFWQGTKDSRLLIQRCSQCSYLRWPPGRICPECQSQESEWVDVRPSGTLWSYAVYHRALAPAFKEDIPYAVGLVELDDGPRIYGIMIGELSELVPGKPVTAVFEAVTDDVTFVRWQVTS